MAVQNEPAPRLQPAQFAPALVDCVARCVAEHFRADTPSLFAGFTVLQALCGAGALLFGWLWWNHRVEMSLDAPQSMLLEQEG